MLLVLMPLRRGQSLYVKDNWPPFGGSIVEADAREPAIVTLLVRHSLTLFSKLNFLHRSLVVRIS